LPLGAIVPVFCGSRVIPKVSAYFVIDSVRKLLDAPFICLFLLAVILWDTERYAKKWQIQRENTFHNYDRILPLALCLQKQNFSRYICCAVM